MIHLFRCWDCFYLRAKSIYYSFAVFLSFTPHINACMLSHFSRVQLFVTPWTIACQAPSVHGILQARILEWVCYALLQGIFLIQGLNTHLIIKIKYNTKNWQLWAEYLECAEIFSVFIWVLLKLLTLQKVDIISVFYMRKLRVSKRHTATKLKSQNKYTVGTHY